MCDLCERSEEMIDVLEEPDSPLVRYVKKGGDVDNKAGK